jgi:hypothetical protein
MNKLMYKKVPIFFLVLFAATWGQGFQGARRWIRLTPAEGHFTVLMPAKPSSETQHIETLVDHSFMAETDWATYEVGYIESTKLSPDPEAALDIARDSLLLMPDSKLLDETKIILSGYPGRELKIASTRGISKEITRLYVVGNRMYRVRVIIAPANKDVHRDVEKFFSSFRLTRTNKQPGSNRTIAQRRYYL